MSGAVAPQRMRKRQSLIFTQRGVPHMHRQKPAAQPIHIDTRQRFCERAGAVQGTNLALFEPQTAPAVRV